MQLNFFYKMLTLVFSLSLVSIEATGSSTPYIMGGKFAPQLEWAVQVVSEGKGTCTGVAINKNQILTASHCINSDNIKVYYSGGAHNIVSKSGEPVDVSNAKMPSNKRYDIALISLKVPHPLKNYAKLDFDYIAPGQSGKENIKHEEAILYGYGVHDGIVNIQPKELYEAQVGILRQQDLNYGTVGIIAMGITGSCSEGDSGGPLIVNGKVVGVLNGSMSMNPDTNSECSYTALNTSDKIVNNWLSKNVLNAE